MNKFKTFISKKLFVTIATVALIMLNKKFGSPFDEATVKEIVIVVAMYLFGQTAIDTVAVLKK